MNQSLHGNNMQNLAKMKQNLEMSPQKHRRISSQTIQSIFPNSRDETGFRPMQNRPDVISGDSLNAMEDYKNCPTNNTNRFQRNTNAL